MKNKLYTIIILLTFSLSSCATAVRGTTQNISVNSEPAGADIYINGLACGQTPKTFKFKRKYNYNVTLQKPGFQAMEFDLVTRRDTATALNLLFPVVGTAAGYITIAAMAGGDLSGPAGSCFLLAGCYGLAAGALLGIVAAGIDYGTGADRSFTISDVNVPLLPQGV